MNCKLAIVMLAALLVSGCGKGTTPAPESKPAASTVTQPGYRSRFAPEQAVAIVNGKKILRRNLDNYIKNSQHNAERKELSESEYNAVGARAISEIVEYELIFQAALEEAGEVISTQVEEKIQMLKQRFPDPKEYADVFGQMKTTEAEFRESLKRQIVFDDYLANKFNISAYPVDEAEARKHYEQNKELYTIGESVTCQEIVVPFITIEEYQAAMPGPAPQITAENRTRAKNKLSEVLKRLEANEDFTEIAREYSITFRDDTKATRHILRGHELIKELEDMAFNTEIDQVSAPLESKVGYHIVKPSKINPRVAKAYDDVEADIKKRLTQEKFLSDLDQFVSELKEQAKIEILL